MAKISSLQDFPVREQANELLGLGNYANALSDFILNCDTPITIGIQGDWGIGKSSLLNMIEENLKPTPGRARFYVIRIETWQYAQFNQEDMLAFSVLNSIIRAVLEQIPATERKDLELENKRIFSKIVQFGSNVLNSYVKNTINLDVKDNMNKASGDLSATKSDFDDAAAEIKRYKDQFITIIKRIQSSDKTKGTFVIMIDDLDRIKPIKAVELLEVIKNFLDVEHCIFVLAVDYSVIERGAEQKLGGNGKDGKSFFDKIIQVPFNMPIASYQTDKYLMSLLGYSFENNEYVTAGSKDNFLSGIGMKSNLTQDDASFFANVTKLSAGQNPRTIKRIVNYANLLKLICKNTRGMAKDKRKQWNLQDAKIVYTIACLQLSWTEIFEYFASNPSPAVLERMEDMNFIAAIPKAQRLFDRYADQEEIQSKISGFFDEFLSIIDEDQNGDISPEEFEPIWQVLKDANLTNAKVASIKDAWKDFNEAVVKNIEGNKHWTPEKVTTILDLFLNTKWNDGLNFRLLSAGKRFSNLTWNKEQVGSVATTGKGPFQFYLNHQILPFEILAANLNEKQMSYFVLHQESHYGTGDIRVEVEKLIEDPERAEVMNKVLDLIIQSLGKSKKRM